jgi:translation initiation factor 1
MNSSLVYSTAFGRTCPGCEQPLSQCVCKKQATLPWGNGAVRVTRETKGRKGKCVTIVTGLQLSVDRLSDLARDLKRKCGSGGTVKDGTIEIQGDHRDVLVMELAILGIAAKKG